MKANYFLLFILILIIHLVLGVVYNGYSLVWIGLSLIFMLLVLALASMNIQWNFYLKAINRIPLSFGQLTNKTRPIALTFDDGPHQNTLAVLSILKKENVKATFFVIGKEIKGKETILKKIAEDGHWIGNHSYAHQSQLFFKSAKNIQTDLEKCSEIIAEITGEKPIFFRPPFGVTTPNLAKAVKNLSLPVIGWNQRSFDTVAKDKTKLLNKILKGTRSNNILLLHDRCKITVEILPELICELKERGFVFTAPSKLG